MADATEGFQPYTSEIDRVLHAPGGPVGRYCNLVARAIAETARQISYERGLVRTTNYAEGWRVEVQPDPDTGFVFTVLNTVTGKSPQRGQSYAGVIEDGSRPHYIRPRNANKWLIFTLPDGRIIKTKLVAHPGTQPQHVVTDAAARVSALMPHAT